MIEAPQPAAGDVAEAPAAPMLPFAPSTPRPMTADEVSQWRARIDRGWQKAKQYHAQFERGLESYAKALVPKPQPNDTRDAKLPFRHVENKKAHTFHATPEVSLLPKDPVQAEMGSTVDTVLPLREKFLNYELSEDGADAQRAMHKTLVDTYAASGWMITKVGHEVVSLADPLTGQLVPVWSKRFISTFSSKKFVPPADFRDTDFDKSPWLAIKDAMPVSQAKRLKWKLPADYVGTAAPKEVRFVHGADEEQASDPEVCYTEVWYRASLFDETVFHPELYRCLILIDGAEEPAWHVDSPYQELTPQGQLTDDSMIGSPIHVDAIRDLPDSAYAPADLVLGEQLSGEVNDFRTGVARRRHASRSTLLVNDQLGQSVIDKITANEGPVPVPGEFIDAGGAQRAAALIQKGTEPRDNYTAQEYAERDFNQAFGMSANQSGNETKRKVSATESRIVQGNSAARAEIDKQRVRRYFIRLVRKFDAIVQRTATAEELAKVLGQQGGQLWEQWRALPGKYAYNIQPDAGHYVDAREYRSQALDLYNQTRQDPAANGPEALRDLYRAFGKDAAKMVVEPKPQPDQPKVAITFNAETAMANPLEAQLMFSVLQQSGYQLDPAMVQGLVAQAGLRQQVAQLAESMPQPKHGGPAKQTEPLSKHQTAKTGGVNGVAA